MKYKKKPIEIEAVQWNGKKIICLWFAEAEESQRILLAGDQLLISTLEGVMRAFPGDWIIRGVKGELYPCVPDIFEMTYEKVVDHGSDAFDPVLARKELTDAARELLKVPVVQSLLYDINLLPEQITIEQHWFYMLSVLAHMDRVIEK